jgi:hypothetical protein
MTPIEVSCRHVDSQADGAVVVAGKQLAYVVHRGTSMLIKTSPRYMRHLLVIAAASTTFAAVGVSQDLDPAGWQSKLRFHAVSAYGPASLAGSAAYVGLLQEVVFPREWGQGGVGYGRRLSSTLAYSGLRNALSFGLDSTLHQDPRYDRSTDTGFWRRTKHAFRRTILTRTDSGGETFATWRLGSAYAANFISNEWYPDRVNTVKLGLTEGTTQIGFDLLANIGSEFWPDLKKKILRRER